MEGFNNILFRKIRKEDLTHVEEERFNSWISSAENQMIFKDYRRIWSLTKGVSTNLKPDVDVQWKKFTILRENHQKARQKARRLYITISGVAATLLLAVTLSIFLGKYTGKTITYTAQDEPVKVELPDNSTVLLNKNSTLTLAKAFNRQTRTVRFSGEAMFEVAKNPQVPFIVEIEQGVSVKVLGTRFNLRTYNDNPNFELKVLSGTVLFGQNDKSVIVEKGKEADFNKSTQTFTQTRELNSNMLAWCTKKFEFDNTPILEAAQSLERYLNKNIILPKNVSELRYTGSFDNPGEKEIAEVISLAMGWDYKITDKAIVFKIKKQTK